MTNLKNQTDKLFAEFEEKLQQIDNEQEANVLKKAEASIIIVHEFLRQLKEIASSHRFKKQDEEIFFFKHVKPQFFSKLIYFTKIFNIESKRPNGIDKVQ